MKNVWLVDECREVSITTFANMAQVELALGTAESSTKIQVLSKSWGIVANIVVPVVGMVSPWMRSPAALELEALLPSPAAVL